MHGHYFLWDDKYCYKNGLLQGIIKMDETYVGGKPRTSNVRKTEYEKDTFK